MERYSKVLSTCSPAGMDYTALNDGVKWGDFPIGRADANKEMPLLGID